MESRFNLDKYNDNQTDYLGITVWWKVTSCSIPVDIAVQALSGYGFEENLIQKPSVRKAFGKATRIVGSSHKHKIARRIVDMPQKAVVGVVGETTDIENEALSYKQEATVRLNKETGSLDTFGDESLGVEFREKYEGFLDTVDENDFRAFVKRVIEKNNGIMIREQGGVYFVPRKNENQIVAVDRLLKELNIGKMGIIRIVNGVREREETWESFQENIQERVKDALEGVERISKSAKCLARYEDKMDQISKMADAYTALCEEEERAEGIREMLENAESVIAKKMAELQKDNN
jgi:hypothetical protein